MGFYLPIYHSGPVLFVTERDCNVRSKIKWIIHKMDHLDQRKWLRSWMLKIWMNNCLIFPHHIRLFLPPLLMYLLCIQNTSRDVKSECIDFFKWNMLFVYIIWYYQSLKQIFKFSKFKCTKTEKTQIYCKERIPLKTQGIIENQPSLCTLVFMP